MAETDLVGSQGEPAGAAPAGSEPAAAPAGTPGGGDPAAPAAPTQPGQIPQGYVPVYRVRELAERNRQYEARIRELEGAARRPAPGPEPEFNPETEAIKRQFFSLFPQAKGLFATMEKNPEMLAKLEEALQVLPNVAADSEQRWVAQGAQTLRTLATEGAKIVGAELPLKARAWHEAAFIASLEADPELRNRYMRGDIEGLVREYWQDVNTNMLDPIRRSAAVKLQQRGDRVARVPTAGPGSGPVGKGGTKPKSEDDLHDQAWEALQAQRS
jgi:hypothetical protein